MNADQLAFRLGSLSASSALPASLRRALLRLLARGQPVAMAELAATAEVPLEQVRQAIADQPDTEYDEQGRIVGHGLTLRPTPHLFIVEGRQLYTWCALDTLIFPSVLGKRAEVDSPCKATGIPVHLVVEPDRVARVEPSTAVVSIVTPDSPASVRAAFCNKVHFFASPQAAQPWLDDDREAYALPVAEAYRLGLSIAQIWSDEA